MEKLGVELPALLTQIVNFAILLLILTKFLYKPILKALEDRQKKIEEGLSWAEKAKKDALKLKEEILKSGHKEVADMKHKLEAELDSSMDEERRQMLQETVNIARAMVKQLLGEILSQREQEAYLERELKKIAKVHEK